MRIKAVIFDLDGVIADTAEHHYRAWKRLAEELGIPCPSERKDQVRGVSRRRSLAIVLTGNPQANEDDLQDLVTEEEAERLMARKDGYYQELIQEIGSKDLLPGVRELISDLRRQEVKAAVATVSKNAGDVLERLGILEEFNAIVDGHSGARSKPAPDLFLQAAARLGVAPGECVVVEDAPAGIEAAEAAGMFGVAVGPQERFADVKPELVIPSLVGLSYERLVALLAREEERTKGWRVEAIGFEPVSQRRFETNFTVGNGYLGTRGTLEEGHPGELRATLIHGLFDAAPIFFSELANAPDWTHVQLSVDGEPFSLQHGETLSHKRWLDLRDGVLHRYVRWRSSGGRTVEVRTTRFASMADPHLCIQAYAITAMDWEGETEIRTWLPASPENPGIPPFPEVGLCHWERVSHGFLNRQTMLLHLRTRRSRAELAMAMGLLLAGIPDAVFSPLGCPHHPGMAIRFRLGPGETAVVTKFVTVYTSHDAADPSQAALDRLDEAKRKGFAAILRDHRASWRELWQDCDIVIEGDEVAQAAVRFNLYHLLIAAPRTAEASIPAKTLTGFGYRGHMFWDTEIFMLPFFVFTQPEVARRILAYRYHTLPGARENARYKGFRGAMYAWESAHDGREVTPRWVPRGDGTLISILTGELEH
ncbi:beta-phosphoglucomutase, partial [Candidatus Bipolaricaulota bacterium]|nr:beta-phosphoglucomutase [Candidatus Bipolaricaulota bacterium]